MKLVATCLVLLALGGVAPAAEPHDLQLGNALFSRERYAEAFVAFQRGYARYRTAVFLRNMAYCKMRLLKHDEAYRLIGDYLARFPREPDVARMRELRRGLEASTKVEVVTVPRGAEVFLDTVAAGSLGRTPGTWTLQPGPHLLILQMRGCSSTTSSFIAVRNQMVRLRMRLKCGGPAEASAEAAPAEGLLSLRARPEDAEVRLDSRLLGRAPLVGLRLPAGAHRLAVAGASGRFAAPLQIVEGRETVAEVVLPRSRGIFYAGLGTAAAGVLLASIFGGLALAEQGKCRNVGGESRPLEDGHACNLSLLAALADGGLGLAVAGAVVAVIGYLWAEPRLRVRTRPL